MVTCAQTKSDAQTDTTRTEGVIAFRKNRQKKRINLLKTHKVEEEAAPCKSLPKLSFLSWNATEGKFIHRSKKQQAPKTQPTSLSDFKIFRKIGQGSYS